MGVMTQCEHGVAVSRCRCPKVHDPVRIVPCPPTCKASEQTEPRIEMKDVN